MSELSVYRVLAIIKYDSILEPLLLIFQAEDSEHPAEQFRDYTRSVGDRSDILTNEIETTPVFVIYSSNENVNQNKAYWNIDKGWVDMENASFFTKNEANALENNRHLINCLGDDWKSMHFQG